MLHQNSCNGPKSTSTQVTMHVHIWCTILWPYRHSVLLQNCNRRTSTRHTCSVVILFWQSNLHANTKWRQHSKWSPCRISCKVIRDCPVFALICWECWTDLVWYLPNTSYQVNTMNCIKLCPWNNIINDFRKCFAVPRNKLCIGSTTKNLGALKYGNLIKTEWRHPRSDSSCSSWDFVQLFKWLSKCFL